MNARYLLLIVLAVPLFSFAQSQPATQGTTPVVPGITTSPNGLPAGCHVATAAEAATAQNGSIIAGKSYVCPNDLKVGITNDVGEAKKYLNTLPKRPLSNCAPPTENNVNMLDNGFAVCAAAFFKAYTAQYGTVYITSAFRNGASGTAGDGSGKSANECAGGAAGSNHQRGYAMDVNPASESLYPKLWQFASQNPQFGICFPHQDGRGGTVSTYPDRPHMILAGIGGNEAAACARQGVTQACKAGSSFVATPVQGVGSGISQSPVTPQTTPQGTIANSLRSLFQQPQQTTPQQQTPVQQASPITFPQTDIGTTFPQTTPTQGSSSIAELLIASLNQPTTTTATGTSVRIVVTGATTTATTSLAVLTPTVVINNFPDVRLPTTFTSQDLGQVNPQTTPAQPVASSSRFFQVLATLKQVLINLLERLSPFGGRTATSPDLQNDIYHDH